MRTRIRSRRNPKVRNLTPEQEAEFERAERMLYRADIYERGVAAILNREGGEYACSRTIAEASRILAGAVEIRAEADKIRQDIRNAEMAAEEAAEAAKPKRKKAVAK